MEYGATIWNPYIKRDIDILERIQNRAIRFITKDYKTRTPGSITQMRKELELATLEERRTSLRLILMYKVVEGLVPALPPTSFVKNTRPKRQIKPKQYTDYQTSNIIDKHACNNSKSLKIPESKTPQYKHSFFVDTVIHWNHLPEEVVHASTTETALQKRYQ